MVALITFNPTYFLKVRNLKSKLTNLTVGKKMTISNSNLLAPLSVLITACELLCFHSYEI